VIINHTKPYTFAGESHAVFTPHPNAPDTMVLAANQPPVGASGMWANLTPNQFAQFVNPTL